MLSRKQITEIRRSMPKGLYNSFRGKITRGKPVFKITGRWQGKAYHVEYTGNEERASKLKGAVIPFGDNTTLDIYVIQIKKIEEIDEPMKVTYLKLNKREAMKTLFSGFISEALKKGYEKRT